MLPSASADLILEVERLQSLPASARESEGIYASDSQLKLLRKRIRAAGDLRIAGMAKFVADFSSNDSKLLRLIDALEGSGNG